MAKSTKPSENTFTKTFHFFTEARVSSLEASLAKDPNALALVDTAGRSIHTRVLDQVLLDATSNAPASIAFDESRAALRWLLDRQAPIMFRQHSDSPLHNFVTNRWSDNSKAPAVAQLMREYIALGLVDINGDVVCEQWNGRGRETPDTLRHALRACCHHGNHGAARELLLAGSDEGRALAGTIHRDLAALAASYSNVPNHEKVAAAVIETKMGMRIAQVRHDLEGVAANEPAPRRRLAV